MPEETPKDILISISSTLYEHLADIAEQLTHIAGEFEMVTGRLSDDHYGTERGFIRTSDIGD